MVNYDESIKVSIKAKAPIINKQTSIKNLKIDTSKYKENKSCIKKSIPLKF